MNFKANLNQQWENRAFQTKDLFFFPKYEINLPITINGITRQITLIKQTFEKSAKKEKKQFTNLLKDYFIKNVYNIECSVKNEIKLNNLKKALQYIDEQYKPIDTNTDISIEMIKKLHSLIGKDIISDCGEFRKNDTKPYGKEYPRNHYTIPEHIERNLQLLIQFYNEHKSEDLTFIDKIHLMSLFMCNFLKIHPFSNGNGRVARLVLNLMLREIILIPITLSIYHSFSEEDTIIKDREIYLRCISECQLNADISLFSTYILLSIRSHCSFVDTIF